MDEEATVVGNEKQVLGRSEVLIANHPMIEMRRLFRWFGNTCAVKDVSFEVARGEVFGYIGPNGAGKTTSMRILSTLDTPSAGDALVDGLSVVNDPDRVRRRLGYMPDYFGTYANVNCAEYLDFFARAYGLIGRDRHRAIKHVMDFTGLDILAEKPINGLSKGMRQRLCLGRAMIHDPAVLILDEPAAGLDPRARIELREMIGQLAADGKSLLVSSHILTELAEMCDRIAIIEHGQLLATGTVDEIMHRLEGQGQELKQRFSRLAIDLLGKIDEAVKWFEGHEVCEYLSTEGTTVRVKVPADREFSATLVREVVNAGFDIVSMKSESTTLEQVFLEVTRGRVQ